MKKTANRIMPYALSAAMLATQMTPAFAEEIHPDYDLTDAGVRMSDDAVMEIDEEATESEATESEPGKATDSEPGKATDSEATESEPEKADGKLDITDGFITITSTGYTVSEKEAEDTSGETPYTGDYEITGTSKTNRVIVKDGEHNITIRDLDIRLDGPGSYMSAFALRDGAHVNLTIEGTNYLKSAAKDFRAHGTGGGIRLENDAILTIDGEGSLEAEGRSSSMGGLVPGIGSDATVKEPGTIIVYGGTIKAIGGGCITSSGTEDKNSNAGGPGMAGNITIEGGDVTAIGGEARIGGAGMSGNITIDAASLSGNVKAIGGNGTQSGGNGLAGNVTFENVTPELAQNLTVTAGTATYGDGGNALSGTIRFENSDMGDLVFTGADSEGTAGSGAKGTVTIENSRVAFKGGAGSGTAAAGIASDGAVSVTGSTVKAEAGGDGASGIDAELNVTGSYVYAVGGSGAASFRGGEDGPESLTGVTDSVVMDGTQKKGTVFGTFRVSGAAGLETLDVPAEHTLTIPKDSKLDAEAEEVTCEGEIVSALLLHASEGEFNRGGKDYETTYTYTGSDGDLEEHAKEMTYAPYMFEGWYDTQEREGEIVESIPNGSFNTKEYWAGWKTPFRITQQPVNESFHYGYTGKTLSVETDAEDPEAEGSITYQWYVSDDGDAFTEIPDAKSAVYPIPDGFPGGTVKHYYCVVSLNGYTAETEHVTVSVAKSYTEFNGGVKTYRKGTENAETSFTYGDVITLKVTPKATSSEPIRAALEAPQPNQMAVFDGERQITEAKDVVSGTELVFDIDTVEAGLTPDGDGTHTLSARYVGDDNMSDRSEEVSVTVKWLEDEAEATVEGETGEHGWMKGDVSVKAPEGYQIGTDAEGEWKEALTYTEDTDETEVRYHLKNKDGQITDEKTVSYKLDKTAPVLSGSAVDDITPPSAGGHAEFTDALSGMDGNPAFTLKTWPDGETKPTLADAGDGTFTLTGVRPDREYTVEARAKDMAGNETVSEMTVFTGSHDLSDAEIVIKGADGLVYDGNAKTPTVEVWVGEGDHRYKLDESAYTVRYVNTNGGQGDLTGAGTVTVIVTAVEGKGYTGHTQSEFTIAKAQGAFSVSDTVSKDFSGGEFVIEVEVTGDGVPEFKLVDGEDVLSLGEDGKTFTPLGAGEATVTVTLPDSPNYIGAEGKDVTVTVTDNVLDALADAAKAKDYTMDAETVPGSASKEDLQAALEAVIGELVGEETQQGLTFTVNVTEYTAPTPGTKTDADGTQGSFKAEITFSRGSYSRKEEVSGVIEAEAWQPANYESLKQAIEDAYPYEGKEDLYTADSWQTFSEALAAAKEMNENRNEDTDSQREVDAAVKALRSAMEGLKKKPADYANLEDAVQRASELSESDYTADTWAPFAEKLEAARQLLEDRNLDIEDQETVNAAEEELEDAMSALKKHADRTGLAEEAERARALDSDAYTADSRAALKEALDAADRLLADESLTEDDQQRLDDAEEALRNAAEALKKRADVSGLKESIRKAESVKADDYTEESMKALREKLEAARAVAEDDNLSADEQKKADDAKAALDAAINGLVRKPADRSGLKAAIEEAKRMTESLYTTDSWKTLSDALKTAEALDADPNATQDAIDGAVKALREAVRGLVKKTSSGTSGGHSGGSYSGRGYGSASGTVATGFPDYVVRGGTWAQDANGRWTYTNGRAYANEWAAVQNPYANTAIGQAAYDWFRFAEDGTMLTGWFTDGNGDTYYLHPVSDGTKGHMYTGWQWIDDNGDGTAECYYFETVSNGYKGRLYKNTVTPDGYIVNEKGQWSSGGVTITRPVSGNP